MKIITYELCKNNIKVSKEGILESHNLWQGLWKEIYKRTSEIDQQDYKCHSKRETVTLCQDEKSCAFCSHKLGLHIASHYQWWSIFIMSKY
jgi:hypothetical protein